MALDDGQTEGWGEDEEHLVFYHKNGEFRKYEEKRHRDLATGVIKTRPGLFRALVSTRGNRLMLMALVAVTAFALVYSLVLRGSNEGTLEGTECSLSAFSFDGSVYVSLRLKEPGTAGKGAARDYGEARRFEVILQVLNTDGAVAGESRHYAEHQGGEVFVRDVFPDYDITLSRALITGGGGGRAVLEETVRKK
ncbi:MAG: hypothetical protein J1F14_08200 [Treponema sp.]|nr:hypothetical protein [Treponema sp.]